MATSSAAKETPWIDAWIRWERDSKEVYDQDDDEENDADAGKPEEPEEPPLDIAEMEDDIDSASDVLINLTTSEGARFAPGEEDAAVGAPSLMT